jgi:hypothetical protein
VGAAVIAQAMVAAVIALPWLTLLPLHGIAAVLAQAITLVAALHGAGLVVARLAGQPAASPWLVIQWGTAALIGLSGAAIAASAGTLAGHAVLVFGFAAVHTGSLGLRFSDTAARLDTALAESRAWVVPVIALVGLGALAVLGAASGALVRPFDDDGHVLAQLRRLLDTGGLGDPLGYPRRSQLGGQIALAAIASGAGDGAARLVEPLAQVLGLALVIARVRARDATTALWAVLLVIAGFGLALAPADPLPCWTAVGLCGALYAMISEPAPAPALPIAITAGAVIALRHELAPIAVVALVAAWWPRRADHRRTAQLIGGALAICVPFVIARAVASRAVPTLAHEALATPRQLALIARLALAAAIAVPGAYVLQLALPGSRGVRWAAVATAVALGALAAQLTGAGGYSLRLAWPIAIGFVLSLAIELARSRWAGPAALFTSLVLCVVVVEGRDAPGRLRWSRRVAELAAGIYAVERPPGDGADPYAAVLAGVPAGATIAIWVSEPERLDYRRYRIFDLRTPAGAHLRATDPTRRPRLAALLGALAADYLLVEADGARAQRARRDLIVRLVCQAWPAACGDDLEALAHDHRIVAQHNNVQLIELSAPRP